MADMTSFDDFHSAWMEDVSSESENTLQLGRKFAVKLVSQWKDLEEIGTEVVWCDGSGDGGIDVAILEAGTHPDIAIDGDGNISGSIWYLVQSKYGTAMQGPSTILSEGLKIINTLVGKTPNLNGLSTELFLKLKNFISESGDDDRIILTIATDKNISLAESDALEGVKAIGQSHFGHKFDVAKVSVETIFQRIQDELSNPCLVQIPIDANLIQSGDKLLVGSISLPAVGDMIRSYEKISGDVDRIYEKNIRKYLGSKGKINSKMKKTLSVDPEDFGLFNNGITIVTSEFSGGDGKWTLINPYIVNGCQTTRTIYEIFRTTYQKTGTGQSEAIENWRVRFKSGFAVLKVVRVGDDGDKLLQDITKYTNSQNAVRDKDYAALTDDFKKWQTDLGKKYGVYLEIQRGGWDSQKAFQKQNPGTQQFVFDARASELIKVFGSGWLGEAGLAFNKNPPFLPQGDIFKRIMVSDSVEAGGPFGADDLFAAYLLSTAGKEEGFGKASHETRRLSRFIFYFVAIELLKDLISKPGQITTFRKISLALIKVFQDGDARGPFLQSCTGVIDRYFNPNESKGLFFEKAFKDLGQNINSFLKNDEFGRNLELTPNLQYRLDVAKEAMSNSAGKSHSVYEIVNKVV